MMRNLAIISAMLAIVTPGAVVAAPGSGWLTIHRDRLCVTEGYFAGSTNTAVP